jgi:YjbR
MVSIETLRQMVLGFPETDEHPHFDRIAFRVKKKIFATFRERDQILNIKLSPIEQSVFCKIDPAIIYPVPGKWGLHGATTFELKKAKKNLVKDALTRAYCHVAPPALSDKYVR